VQTLNCCNLSIETVFSAMFACYRCTIRSTAGKSN